MLQQSLRAPEPSCSSRTGFGLVSSSSAPGRGKMGSFSSLIRFRLDFVPSFRSLGATLGFHVRTRRIVGGCFVSKFVSSSSTLAPCFACVSNSALVSTPLVVRGVGVSPGGFEAPRCDRCAQVSSVDGLDVSPRQDSKYTPAPCLRSTSRSYKASNKARV